MVKFLSDLLYSKDLSGIKCVKQLKVSRVIEAPEQYRCTSM
ncbi:hypothetical protein PTUN_a2190 [Pseudoalteromonas tunicata]|nr:hypothetical protein PTUN_a2190 [Pseudoalteromonas tunicata]